jgi:hypothetical protein
MHALDSIQQQI